MKNYLTLYLMEQKKYQKSRLLIIFSVYLLINIFMTVIQFRNGVNKEGVLIWYSIFDANSIFKVILCPIMLASLIGYAVQVENNHNMWKVIRSTGTDLKDLYTIKFMYFFIRVVLLFVLEWLIIYFLSIGLGLKAAYPLVDSLIRFGGTVLISFMIMAVHYCLSLKFSNQVVSLSVAVICSLIGVITLLISVMLMRVFIYSWYGYFIQIQYSRVNNEFVGVLNPISLYPYLSLIIGLIIFEYGKKIKVGE